jgi:hypothetical protein
VKTSSTHARQIHRSRTVIDSGGKAERSSGRVFSAGLDFEAAEGFGSWDFFFGAGFARCGGMGRRAAFLAGLDAGFVFRFGIGKSLSPCLPEITGPVGNSRQTKANSRDAAKGSRVGLIPNQTLGRIGLVEVVLKCGVVTWSRSRSWSDSCPVTYLSTGEVFSSPSLDGQFGRTSHARKVKKIKLLEFTGGCRMSGQFTKVGLNGT